MHTRVSSVSSVGLNDWPIDPVDRSLEPQLRARIDGKAKPLGALGRLEDLAIQLGLIWHPRMPRTERATVFVFAADHGIAAEGVSLYPADVTRAMVATYRAGRAGVNVLARALNVDVQVIDAGVDADIPAHPQLIDAKIRRGSRNAAREPALTPQEARDGLAGGASIVAAAIATGTEVVAIGEMGIGNATSPLDVLSEFGGYEIAMMAGAVLASAGRRRPVIVDGFIAAAAALVAVRLQPAARDYCVFSHRSAERGHDLLLNALGVTPYLDLGLRLGDGAVMAVPLLRAASAILTEMADLSDVLAGTLEPVADRRHG
jgi:nicotinate-nucleotide--dimethylbenzimidazole phosphoribosyltransferase